MQVCKPRTSSSARIVAPIPKTTTRNARRMKMTCSDRFELQVREVWERTCSTSTERLGLRTMPTTTGGGQGRLRNRYSLPETQQIHRTTEPTSPCRQEFSCHWCDFKTLPWFRLLCSGMDPSTIASFSCLWPAGVATSRCNTKTISRDPAVSS